MIYNPSPIQRIAILSVHTSPLAPLGQKKTGGMNVYVRDYTRALAQRGVQVDIYTRATDPDEPYIQYDLGCGCRVINITAGPLEIISNDEIASYLDEFAAARLPGDSGDAHRLGSGSRPRGVGQQGDRFGDVFQYVFGPAAHVDAAQGHGDHLRTAGGQHVWDARIVGEFAGAGKEAVGESGPANGECVLMHVINLRPQN